MSPPPKVEVKVKEIHRQMPGQTDRQNLIGKTGRPKEIETTHPIGLVSSWIRIQL